MPRFHEQKAMTNSIIYIYTQLFLYIRNVLHTYHTTIGPSHGSIIHDIRPRGFKIDQ